jgi:hypothetical protein
MIGTLDLPGPFPPSVTSALSNLPVIHQQSKNWRLTRQLAIISGVVVAVGLAATILISVI